MAHFRGTLHGCRGEASRLGSKGSGLYVTANGWNLGVSVTLYVDEHGEDHARVTLTEGSGYNAGRSKTLGDFTKDDLGKFGPLIRELSSMPGGMSIAAAELVRKLRDASPTDEA